MSDQNEYLEAILQAEMKYKKQVEESVKGKLVLFILYLPIKLIFWVNR